MAHLPPGAGIDPGGTHLDSAYPEGAYEPPADLLEGESRGSDRSLLTEVLAALVVVGLPVVVLVVLGTPRLESPTRWPDVESLVDGGTLPGGLILNLILLVLALAWVGSLALLAASVSNRVPGQESRLSEPSPQSPPDEENRRGRKGKKSRKQKKQAEDDSEEPWYRQSSPLFAEPIVDMERVEPPSGAEPSGAAPGEPPGGAVPAGAPGGAAETYGGFSLSAPSTGVEPPMPPMGAGPMPPGAEPPMPPMGAGPMPPGAEYPLAPTAGETGLARPGEPPEVVPIRAYYVARSADTLRSVAAQFLNSPARWEEVRSLNAAYPGIAGLGPDDLITEGSALMLPGDPMPWGKPDPVYLWTLAERFLFTAWGREPSPSEVVPFWKGLALGMEIDEDALGDLGEIPGAAAALTTPAGLSPEGPDQVPTGGIPMPQAPAAEPPAAYDAEPAVESPIAQPAYEPTGAPAPAYDYDPAAAEPAAHAPLPTVESSPAAEPSDQQPSPYEPAAYQPPAAYEPPVPPPAAEPPTYQPPAAEPPTYQPPAAEPPTYQPLAAEPPTYQPPAAEPPTYQPPAAYEPPVQPPVAEPHPYAPPEPEAPEPYAVPEPYVEQEAPPLPQFMPSVTGPDTSAQQMGGLVTQRSLAGTAIGDAMLLWRLSRLRQRRSGVPGGGQVPDPLVESLERNARMDSLRLIEAAMRQLRAVTVAQLKEKPKVMAVRVGAYGFEVLLDEPAPAPEGWRAASGGYVLELNEGTTLEQLDAVGHGMSLCPALVPVGDTVEGPLLLNIEEIGCLMVSGTNIASASLLTSIAEALGSSPMASDVRVVTVGVSAPVGPGWERILAASFDSPQLEELLVSASAPEPASPGLDVLVVGPGHDVLIQRAGQIASSPRSNLALVGATSSAAARWPWRIHVDDTARAVVQPIACTMMAARAMSPELAASLSAEASDQFNPLPGV